MPKTKTHWRIHTLSRQDEVFEFAIKEHPQSRAMSLHEVRVQYSSRLFSQFHAYDILEQPETVFVSGEGFFTIRENAREIWNYLVDKGGFKHIRQDETDMISTLDW